MDVTIPCPCPPKADGTARHEQDTVTIPDTLDFRRTLTVRQEIRFAVELGDDLTLGEMTAVLAEAYLLHCIDAWTLETETGAKLPVTKANVRVMLLSNIELAEKVGDAADKLYSDKVVLPLLNRAPDSSPPTPTPEPTSATTNGSPHRGPKRPSKRSSTTTSQMVVTGPMAASPGGVSNSWQS